MSSHSVFLILHSYKIWLLILLVVTGALLTILLPNTRAAGFGGVTVLVWIWLGTRNYFSERVKQQTPWLVKDSTIVFGLTLFAGLSVYSFVRILCLTPIAIYANCSSNTFNASLIAVFIIPSIPVVIGLLFARRDLKRLQETTGKN